MREIIYSDSGDGRFEPEPTPVQRRKATLQARKDRERRRERWALIGAVVFFGIVGAAWIAAHVAWVYLSP